MSWTSHKGRRVTLPVQRINGQWELIHGGGVPVPNGVFAELSINLNSVQDGDFKTLVTQELSVQVLPRGATLYVALSDRGHALRAAKDTISLDIPLHHVPEGATRFEPITLGPINTKRQDLLDEDGGLWIRQIGLNHCELQSGQIFLPEGLSTSVAKSLNHALTLLSERYENHRISHTGSVYSKVFYQETNKQWLPLSVLRDGISHRAEESLIALAWSQLEKKIGWCRVPPPQLDKKKYPRTPRDQEDY